MAEDLNKAIPRSFLKIVPQCGHFYSYEQPAGVSETILTFLGAFAAGREPATAVERGRPDALRSPHPHSELGLRTRLE